MAKTSFGADSWILPATKDSVPVPFSVAQFWYIKAMEGKAFKKLTDTLNKEVGILNATISSQDSVISELKANRKSTDSILFLMNQNAADCRFKDSISKKAVNDLEKKLKWANTKTVGIGIIGLALITLILIKT